MTDFQEGDHVFVGRASHRKVHWQIASINKDAHTANLVSGMTGRHLTDIPLDALTMHVPKEDS